MQQMGEPHKAAALLAPLFSRGKQAFLPSMAAIQVGGGGGSQSSSSFDRLVSRLQAISLPVHRAPCRC
jgi:hypothetical protein